MGKRYDGYCPLAHALGMVGERWSLLIALELMRGPKRYTDLVEGLPGIGTNILAARLRALEEGGVVRKRKLPPPAASTVYELTEYGEGLDEVMYAMARWGIRTLGPPGPADDLDHAWGLNAFPAMFDPEAARGLTATFTARVDDDVFAVGIDDGCLSVAPGPAEHPDLELATDMATFYELHSGELDPREAIADGRLTADGDLELLARCFRVFSFAPRRPAGTPAAA